MKQEKKSISDFDPIAHELKQNIPKYRRLRRLSIIVTSLVALIPLLIMTIINYYQAQNSYHAESEFAISRILSNNKQTLEFVIKERRAVLSLIISQTSFQDLSNNDKLKMILKNLNSSFGGFVDMGIIDSLGNQTYYSGPYDLRGINYKNQSWFSEVLVRGEYVSEVFLGHRKLPHFVIAFQHDNPDGGVFYLRATIDMEMVNRVLYSMNLDNSTDAFLINQAGDLQTASLFYGEVLSKVDLKIPKRFRSREVIDEYQEQGKWITLGYSYIENTPFILVVIKYRENPFVHWLSRRIGLIWFLLVSISLILAVVIYGASHTVKKLRELDKKRALMFHNIEYTNKMATIGRMAAGVAHEINNPLAIINEKAGLLSDMSIHAPDLSQREKFSALADSIINSVERCSKVTHSLLGFARRMDARKENIDLKLLIEEVIGFQKTDIEHKNINVKLNIPADLPAIESDKGQLQQVFLNIINNAFAAIDVGGIININVERYGVDKVAVIIIDNGVGITEENIKNIFEPFYSTKGEFGTGLGLSITNDIVQKLGGKIEVKSEHGQGSSFSVILPVKAKY